MSRAFEILAPLVPTGITLGLDAMRAALAAEGDPQRAIPAVHVAGTNGKGSVSAVVDRALRAAGLRAGLYTSPHLHRFVERVRIDGDVLDDDRAAALALRIREGVDGRRLPALSFFEAATLLAWLAFREARVEVAVMEVGLGGRLDATTVCEPLVTVITRIGLDHTDRLGPTLDLIAREKAGILVAGVPCVLGPDLTAARNPEARAAIEEVARVVGAPLVDTPPYALVDGTLTLPWRGATLSARPSLAGAWQAGNLATAARALACLAERGLPVTLESVREGIERVTWPARMERVGDVLLDVAHNVDGATALAASLAGERVGAMVFGASRDKDVAGMLAQLEAVVPPARWFFGAAAMPRALEPEALASMRGGVACESPEGALAAARAVCEPGDTVLVCGSIYFVAAVRAGLLGLEQEPPIAL